MLAQCEMLTNTVLGGREYGGTYAGYQVVTWSPQRQIEIQKVHVYDGDIDICQTSTEVTSTEGLIGCIAGFPFCSALHTEHVSDPLFNSESPPPANMITVLLKRIRTRGSCGFVLEINGQFVIRQR
jgi:hypothetical protein